MGRHASRNFSFSILWVLMIHVSSHDVGRPLDVPAQLFGFGRGSLWDFDLERIREVVVFLNG